MHVELIDNMKKLGYVIESCRMHILGIICYCSHPNMIFSRIKA